MTTHHDCAQAGCHEDATYVVVESQPLAMLFHSGAGLLCERHAEAMTDIGGVPCSLEAFIKAARAEHSEQA